MQYNSDTELKDNFDELKDNAFEDGRAVRDRGGGMRGMFRSNRDDSSLSESVSDGSRMTMDVVLPILGSFQEGFYDPLT